jgi:hypothetical protein
MSVLTASLLDRECLSVIHIGTMRLRTTQTTIRMCTEYDPDREGGIDDWDNEIKDQELQDQELQDMLDGEDDI